ncbi:MAG: hypothetical protein JO165_06895 [Candidatus Eremiobacteraeota bacterium]|nr:hypothetical protein [Candidatus Eremiobacteraeota bacterium]
MRRGIYSIGTNSTRALVADVEAGNGKIVEQFSIGTRLGEGLKERGHLNEDAMARTVEALREHRRHVEPLTEDVVAIATSAVRRADNTQAFANAVRQTTGATLRVIEGEEEARCSFTGAVAVAPRESGVTTYGVLDPGGGSTEYATGTRGNPQRTVSCEIGAVRLSEALPELLGKDAPVPAEKINEARGRAREALRVVGDFEKVDRLVFVGGTATTSISILRGRREDVDVAQLTVRDVENIIARLASLPVEDRKAIAGMNPQRADILLAGALILAAALELTQHQDALVAGGDLLLGYLLRHRNV